MSETDKNKKLCKKCGLVMKKVRVTVHGPETQFGGDAYECMHCHQIIPSERLEERVTEVSSEW